MNDSDLKGGCRCAAVRYVIRADVAHTSICHCSDCRRSSGAPCVAWMGVPNEGLAVTQGSPKRWRGDRGALRDFCADCGTHLFYTNVELIPGLTDVAIATLDDPERCPPQIQVQALERIGWLDEALKSPSFDRYPE